MRISVVIPAHNEEKYIAKTIKSLQNQTRKPNEIIVVNNASSDKTEKIVNSLRIKIIKEKRKGCGWARQKGFEKTSGDIIASTDADTILPKDWLEKIEKAYSENPNAVAVGGPYQFDTNKLKVATKFIGFLWIVLDGILSSGANIPGVNMSVKKEAFERVGGYKRKGSYEDLDLSIRLKKIGKVIFLKNLIVTTSFRRYRKRGFFNTVWEYMKNYWKYRFKKSRINLEDIR